MSDWARYWAIDLHVHTPGSADADGRHFGSAADIVAAAVAAGLDAIAITDHNTAEWCDAMEVAAKDQPLIVLPGVEISTTEGHLLAIWEEGTDSAVINEVLVCLGIRKGDRGKLDIAASVGFADAAREVVDAGGVAIAAHIDKPKGLLGITVAAHLKKTLMEPCLCGAELVDLSKREQVEQKLAGERNLAIVQGSDTWDPAISQHGLVGIGSRRTWIKASRPDLLGLKHALADPDLRIRVGSPPAEVTYPVVDNVELIGGFLNGQRVDLCPDLNCMVGGTGAGKSLVLEAIRYALDQQVDAAAFPTIAAEVIARLNSALGAGMVRVELRSGGARYRVDRAHATDVTAQPQVYQFTGDDWVGIDTGPRDLVAIAAFSQGEVLEYSRQPVGRMSLVDAGVDLSDVDEDIESLIRTLKTNARELLAARTRVHKLRERAEREDKLDEQVRELAGLFDSDIVKQQAGWTREASRLTRLRNDIADIELEPIELPKDPAPQDIAGNADLFGELAEITQALRKSVTAAEQIIATAIEQADKKVQVVNDKWRARRAAFNAKLDDELAKVQKGVTLTTLRAQLEDLQTKLANARAAQEELATEAQPRHRELLATREELLNDLHAARARRRDRRRTRVAELNAKTAGFVKLDVPASGDCSQYRAALGELKVGSRVKDEVLQAIAEKIHPFHFARMLMAGDANSLVDDEAGIDAASIARLFANIADKDLWPDLLDLQLIDRPDTLSVKFRKPDDEGYTAIEELAHGQRCTAILVILLADGNNPVLVDQPEDALHAPWIETYLVDRLRSLRGSRQYLFATRSPGIVVSADAEQIITMRATAGRGECEAAGSLERHDLNKLALHHLEGGSTPFRRRSSKLSASIEAD